MALISFDDRQGQEWQVWRVVPATSVLDRSTWMEPEYRDGWLCFESLATGERRRLAPVPEDWHQLPGERLELLCRVARPARQVSTVMGFDGGADAAPRLRASGAPNATRDR